jgi:catechol 2,3-dioxygenase-like lactoylglutathione lyase family enzyme
MRQDPNVVLAVPILACASVEDTIAFYVDRLGFEREWVWGDLPEDGGVRRGEVQLYFMRSPQLAEGCRGREVMLFVEDVDALHDEHRRRGAPIAEPLRDEPWGLREYSVLDPHGHRLRFAESLELIRARSKAATSHAGIMALAHQANAASLARDAGRA